MRTFPLRVLAATAALTLPLTLVACGDDTDEATTTTTAAGGDLSPLLADVSLIADGKLTVCSDIPYEPFEFEDEAGQITGFDFDVVAAMSDELGLGTPEFKTTPFDTIIQALVAGDCDLIASAMTITEERAQQVAFTEPYFDADQSLLVRTEDESTYASLDDLAGKTIGVQSGTTGADYAAENTPEGATIKEFQGAPDLFAALASGDIDAILQDFPVNAYRAAQQPEQFVVTETFPTGEQYGMAMTKEATGLKTALDAALERIRATGEYDDIYTAWFGTAP